MPFGRQTAGICSAPAADSKASATGEETGDGAGAVASGVIEEHLYEEVLLGLLEDGSVDLTSGDAGYVLN